LTNTDPKIDVGIHGSLGTWMLGYPGSVPCRFSIATDAHAHRRGHPFDLGFALTQGSRFGITARTRAILARVEEAERLGLAHSLPFISEVLAQVMKGIAWLRAGRLAEGIPQLRVTGNVERARRRGLDGTFERPWPKAWR